MNICFINITHCKEITKRTKNVSGPISLLIECYKGLEISSKDKRKHIHDCENLKMNLRSEPKNELEIKKNNQTMALAKSFLLLGKQNTIRARLILKLQLKGSDDF